MVMNDYKIGVISIGIGLDIDFLNRFFIESSLIYTMEIYSEKDDILESEDKSFKISVNTHYQF